MKIESLREVKGKLSKIVRQLPSEKSGWITKNGRPCAVLFPVTKETDLESMLLASGKIFGNCWTAYKEGEKKGFPRLEELPDGRVRLHFNRSNRRVTSPRYQVNVIVKFDLIQERRPDPPCFTRARNSSLLANFYPAYPILCSNRWISV